MRSALSEWYGPSESEIHKIYHEGTIALDANVLLSLYRTGPDRRKEILAVLEAVQDRLWIPYQAALEYQRNRLKVVADLSKLYFASVAQRFKKAADDTQASTQTGPAHAELSAEIQEAVSDLCAGLNKKLDALQDRHLLTLEQAQKDDPVRKELDKLLDGRIGTKPNNDTLRERIVEAGRRMKEKIPSGYLDQDKDTPQLAAGDYLMWAEILDYAGQSSRSLLLITNDTKEDWFRSVAGQTIGPRPELVAEIQAVSTHQYHQQPLKQFLEMAGRSLKKPVNNATINDVTTQPAASIESRLSRQVRDLIGHSNASSAISADLLRAASAGASSVIYGDLLRAASSAGAITDIPAGLLRTLNYDATLAETLAKQISQVYSSPNLFLHGDLAKNLEGSTGPVGDALLNPDLSGSSTNNPSVESEGSGELGNGMERGGKDLDGGGDDGTDLPTDR